MTKANKHILNNEVPDDFAVIILSHGRADNLVTMATLARGGYDGKCYIILDDEDDQHDLYCDKFGADRVITFNKEEAEKSFDIMNNFGNRDVVVHARNACFEIAKDLGLKHFLMLDDDYKSFDYRFPKGNQLSHHKVNSLNALFNYMIEFLEVTQATTVCFAQGGDFIGGLGGMYFDKLKRKAMNTFFCNVDRKTKFIGYINEDTTMYVNDGVRGELFLTITDVMVTQAATQANAGGLTGAYLEAGTYVKSFYSVMAQPSCVKVTMMGGTHRRLHHKVNWNNCTPKIINEKYKKVVK